MALRWRNLSLQTRVTCVILLVVGLSAVCAEYLDRRYVWRLAQEKFLKGAMVVLQHLDASITSLSGFHDRTAREAELKKIRANRPDLIEVGLYAFPVEEAKVPVLLAASGETALPKLEKAPSLVAHIRAHAEATSDLEDWELGHRLKIAAPIFIDGKLVGATYAEFSTAQSAEVLGYAHRFSLTSRVITWTLVVLAINLFLYWKVHRPVGRLLLAVKAVTLGRMTPTVPDYGQDEIGELGRKFNEMVDRIHAATEENQQLYDKLQRAHDDLQRKVEEATDEIREKNRDLARTNELLSTAQRETARARRLSAIGQLAATVAHKVGTPLTALSGHVQLLEEDPHLSSGARLRLQTIGAQIERTSRIIQDLLLYARRPEPVVAPLDLNDCVKECVALLRPEIDRRNVILVLSLSPDLWKFEADQQQLQEVFCNLIENALDAMPNGGTLTIRSSRLEASRPGEADGRLAVDIADSGSGIGREDLEQIFQPFFTTKKPGQGTGLGLAIALENVRAHGGQIMVESELGKGARFRVLLPAPGETT